MEDSSGWKTNHDERVSERKRPSTWPKVNVSPVYLGLLIAMLALIIPANAPAVSGYAHYYTTSASAWCCGTRASIQTFNPKITVPAGVSIWQRVFIQNGLPGSINNTKLLQAGVVEFGPNTRDINPGGTCITGGWQWYVEVNPGNGYLTCYWLRTASPGDRHRVSVFKYSGTTWKVALDGVTKYTSSFTFAPAVEAAGGEITDFYSSNLSDLTTKNWGLYGGSGNDTTGTPATPWSMNNDGTSDGWVNINSANRYVDTPPLNALDTIGSYGGAGYHGWRARANY